ncbi:MAG: amino acid ABC transporter substrate-binding protein [Rhodospirillaceae bacterium]|nr:amino acid ABC transporter substrate-binding protein [Rhodospirillaceae bacterium]
MTRRFYLTAFSAVALFFSVLPPASAATIDSIRDRGFVSCGITERMPGFSSIQSDGSWAGMNVDFCKALAAAVLRDASAIKVQSFWIEALTTRDIDVLHAGSTWTLSRDSEKNINFPGTIFYDGQGFLAHAKVGAKNLKKAKTVSGINVCAIAETSTAGNNLSEYIKNNNLDWKIIPVKTLDGMWSAFFGGRCDMVIHDRTALMTVHADRLEGSDDYVVFPETISKEPLSPAVRSDDEKWEDLVRWTTFITIAAEELGVNSKNIDSMTDSPNPTIARLLGKTKGIGKGFGLDDKWAYRVIKQVGNYGEIFERNLGFGSKFKLKRGLNDLWLRGGLMISPPLR